jgi:stage IV sporulation protein B
MTYREKYRRFVCTLLAISVCTLLPVSYAAARNQIPDQLYVTETGEIPTLANSLWGRLVKGRIREGPSLQEDTSAGIQQTGTADGSDVAASALTYEEYSSVSGTYEVTYSLLGKLPLKTVSVSVVPRKSVYAGGIPVGIYMETDGVLVVDTATVTGIDGGQYAPAASILQSGDYIRAADGVSLSDKEDLIACFNQSEGEDVVLDVTRNGEAIQLKVTPVQTGDHDYKAGIWVRNDTQGIGTLTYIEESGDYGALGHGISDVDTGEVLSISGGTLYDADVISIVKGQQGSPGELAGIIRYSDSHVLGTIDENQENGIYGTISNLQDVTESLQEYEAAYRQEVTCGTATILCSVDGTCREYEIEIEELNLTGKDVNKGMVLKVTDPDLLALTGGIVQGMSGSPIIQSGRIVGAVTHVFVNNPEKGYGIFIENMLEQ